jgi:small-conductance mechanosensitive channel
MLSADQFQAMMTQIARAYPAIGAGLITIIAFWLLAALGRIGLRQLGRHVGARGPVELFDLGASVAYWTVVGFGVVIGLGTMGLDVGALVAGLGLTGFAIGFALRDALANLLAGVLILTYRPFRYGDRIAVTGFEGTVVHVDLRYTTIQDLGKRHLIPNQTMYSNPVTVHERVPESAISPPTSDRG